MNRTKRFFSLLIAATLLVGSFVVPVQADTKPIKVYLNGNTLEYDVPPQIVNARTMVPLSLTIQYLTNIVPDWNQNTKTVSLTYNGKFYSHKIGEKVLYIDGKATTFDTPSLIMDSRTLVPVRMLSEGFGIETQWDAPTYSVILTAGSTPAPTPTPTPVTVTSSITTVIPSSSNSNSAPQGQSVSIVVYANDTTSRVKLVDDKSTSLETIVKDYEIVAGQRVFTIKWAPSSGLGFRQPKIYAGNDTAFSNEFKTAGVNIISADKADVSGVNVKSSSLYVGRSVDITITTNTAVNKVWLNTPSEGNTLQTTSNYSTSGTKKTWTITWTPKTYGHYTCYAYGSDANGNSDYYSFIVDVQEEPTQSVSIYSLDSNVSSIDIGNLVKFQCETSNNVGSVKLGVANASTINLTKISSASSGTYLWEGYASIDKEGSNTCTAYAYASGSSSAGAQKSITVKGNTQSKGDASISDMEAYPSPAQVGDVIRITVVTGYDVDNVDLAVDGSSVGYMHFQSVLGSTKSWYYDFTVARIYQDASNIKFTARTIPTSGTQADGASRSKTVQLEQIYYLGDNGDY